RNVTDVDGTDRRVANGRNEVALRGDHRFECQETLEIEIGTKKGEANAELADAPFDRRMVAKKTNRGCFFRRELGEFHETANTSGCRKLGESYLLRLGVRARRRDQVCVGDSLKCRLKGSRLVKVANNNRSRCVRESHRILGRANHRTNAGTASL